MSVRHMLGLASQDQADKCCQGLTKRSQSRKSGLMGEGFEPHQEMKHKSVNVSKVPKNSTGLHMPNQAVKR